MSTNGSGAEGADDAERKSRRELLLKVYETSVAEYRFNVQLTWERAKFFLTLSVTAIAAGVGLLKLALDNVIICLFLAAYFVLLFCLTRHGSDTQQRGKSYTRQAQLTMTLAQRELGLFERIPFLDQPDLHLGLAVTPGQRNPASVIFKRKQREGKEPDKGSIVRVTRSIFGIVMAIEALGVMICLGAAAFAVPSDWWHHFSPLIDRSRALTHWVLSGLWSGLFGPWRC